MANAMYDPGRKAFMDGEIAYLTANIKFVFVDDTDYTVDLVNHNALDDIAALGRVSTSANLSTKTSTAGVADAADETISTVTGDPFEEIVFYEDSGVESTSQLFLYLDTASGLPTTPNGSDITLQFDPGANKIFKL